MRGTNVVRILALLTMVMVCIHDVIEAMQKAVLKGNVENYDKHAAITLDFALETVAEGLREDCVYVVDEVVQLMKV